MELATASEMKEFIARGQWLQSQLEIQHNRYDAALEVLVQASNLAQEIDGRLSQYIIQIQKAQIYHITANDAASRDALIYAQRIQKKLIDNLSDPAFQQSFLSNSQALLLQDLLEAIAKEAA